MLLVFLCNSPGLFYLLSYNKYSVLGYSIFVLSKNIPLFEIQCPDFGRTAYLTF